VQGLEVEEIRKRKEGISRKRDMFGFQKLDSYRCAIQFLGRAIELSGRVTRGYGDLADQLRRAALSVSLNIAEGSGRPEKDSRRFYAIARGSALECAAVLDAIQALGIVAPGELATPRDLLERLVSMLTKMSRVPPS
jgi:four helix bundle protein